MNRDEFGEWLEYHSKAYPSLVRWLNDNSGQAEMWHKLLQSTPIAAARTATDELFASEEQPRGYGEHPRAIKKLAWSHLQQSNRPRYMHGEITFTCHRCRDTGQVSVVSPLTLRDAWHNDDERGVRWCAVACNCNAGLHWSQPPKGVRPMPEWQENRPLFTWDQVLARAEELYPPRYDGQPTDYRAVLAGETACDTSTAYCHLFEAVRALLLDYDERHSQGESLDAVQFSAPYPGEF